MYTMGKVPCADNVDITTGNVNINQVNWIKSKKVRMRALF